MILHQTDTVSVNSLWFPVFLWGWCWFKKFFKSPRQSNQCPADESPACWLTDHFGSTCAKKNISIFLYYIMLFYGICYVKSSWQRCCSLHHCKIFCYTKKYFKLLHRIFYILKSAILHFIKQYFMTFSPPPSQQISLSYCLIIQKQKKSTKVKNFTKSKVTLKLIP